MKKAFYNIKMAWKETLEGMLDAVFFLPKYLADNIMPYGAESKGYRGISTIGQNDPAQIESLEQELKALRATLKDDVDDRRYKKEFEDYLYGDKKDKPMEIPDIVGIAKEISLSMGAYLTRAANAIASPSLDPMLKEQIKGNREAKTQTTLLQQISQNTALASIPIGNNGEFFT
jgi:hypothetical protein